jgi:hypothetical protein
MEAMFKGDGTQIKNPVSYVRNMTQDYASNPLYTANGDLIKDPAAFVSGMAGPAAVHRTTGDGDDGGSGGGVNRGSGSGGLTVAEMAAAEFTQQRRTDAKSHRSRKRADTRGRDVAGSMPWQRDFPQHHHACTACATEDDVCAIIASNRHTTSCPRREHPARIRAQRLDALADKRGVRLVTTPFTEELYLLGDVFSEKPGSRYTRIHNICRYTEWMAQTQDGKGFSYFPLRDASGDLVHPFVPIPIPTCLSAPEPPLTRPRIEYRVAIGRHLQTLTDGLHPAIDALKQQGLRHPILVVTEDHLSTLPIPSSLTVIQAITRPKQLALATLTLTRTGGNPADVSRTLTRLLGRFADHTTHKVARFQDHRDTHLNRLRIARARWTLVHSTPSASQRPGHSIRVAAAALATQRTKRLETRWANWKTAIEERIRCALTRQALYSHALHILS